MSCVLPGSDWHGMLLGGNSLRVQARLMGMFPAACFSSTALPALQSLLLQATAQQAPDEESSRVSICVVGDVDAALASAASGA
jgi:hypothetical protein